MNRQSSCILFTELGHLPVEDHKRSTIVRQLIVLIVPHSTCKKGSKMLTYIKIGCSLRYGVRMLTSYFDHTGKVGRNTYVATNS